MLTVGAICSVEILFAAMNDNQGDAYVDWNLSNLEIRTRTVEKTLEPLVAHVTTLVSQGGPSKYG